MKHVTAGPSSFGKGPASPVGDSRANVCAVPDVHKSWRRGLAIAGCSILLVMVACVVVVVGRGLERRRLASQFPGESQRLGVLPAEFERHEAMLLAWPREARFPFPEDVIDLYRREARLFCDVVQAVWKSVDVIVLVEDSRSQDHAARLLLEAGVPPDAVRFVQVPFHSEWIRDYGPIGLRLSDGSCTLIDAEFVDSDFMCPDPHDDRLPSALGALFELPTVRAPIGIQHGNLLSNGRGLCVATRRLPEDNVARGYDAEQVTRVLKTFYGADQVVFLEALRGEPTGHVDMFVTFPSPDTVVVGRYSPEFDPVNAALLDRNARQLASVGPPCGPLNVVRVPMPPRLRSRDGPVLWPTYTNVVYANDTLLVPVYPGLDSAGESTALALYRQLLPDWTIVGIDTLPLMEVGGGIHCATMNLARAGKMHRADDERSQSRSSMD